ncbi:carboxymuconolactone decarboxylase family protein [Saccharothrix sp.]|uniref:carboxymuconolactone decarboxylase family protein n=1 Tax=Saccharothrix sp. TaxID=1873460 RepID=UPI002810E2AC|nr:carboxymuconolactone decarboxylase family protein [Saccharothrix sp.]
MGRIVRAALRQSLNQIRHIKPVHPNAATGPVAAVYAEVESDFGMLAPPVALHSPAPDALAAAWSLLRETLVAAGNAPRAAKEAVAAAVSRSNTCPYCVTVHTATLRGLTDTSFDAVEAWADRSSTVRPFADDQLPELLGVAVTFHYLNRVVNVFLGESPLPSGAPAVAGKFLGRFMGSHARAEHPPGTSLRLLPEAPTPPDLAWSAGNRVVEDSLGRVAAAFDAGGARVLSDAVRELVLTRLADWDGTAPGISRAWVTDAVAPLPAEDRPAATLALLVAMASYQVDDDTVAAFGRDDRSLVQLVSWAAFAAARRMSTLLHRTTEV